MDTILSYKAADDGILRDFHDGEYFKALSRKIAVSALNDTSPVVVLPLLLYYDDFETVNPLGSKACKHKLGGFYYTLKCMPPQYLSALHNLFLLLLCKTEDKTWIQRNL